MHFVVFLELFRLVAKIIDELLLLFDFVDELFRLEIIPAVEQMLEQVDLYLLLS